MAYQALYRKWRPVVFDDVIGQYHITNTIKNEIQNSRLAHAYLFTGTRGTGKTTTAKILSRAVNCLNPSDGNPCNQCEVCKGIIAETSLDVLEIDAASNTGVENIRDIIEQIQYLPSAGKYKVYIIDEVHMLSTGAFNALLKTLEEPPAHVIFILATTEIQKVPATILSRCQRFDFKTISIADIVSNIEKILAGEGINADYDALEYVAYLGDGSMRDSLSILDQCLAFKNNDLTVSDVTDVVGAVDDALLYEFAADVARCDVTSILRRFNSCVNSGKSCDNIAKGLLSVFREIIMYKINTDDFAVSKLKKQLLEGCAQLFEIPMLVKSINILTDCIASFRTLASQRVLCECALIRLTSPELNTDSEAIAARLSALENRVKGIASGAVPVTTQSAPTVSASPSQPGITDIPLPEPPPETGYDMPVPSAETVSEPVNNAQSEEGGGIVSRWPEVMSALSSAMKIRIITALTGAVPGVEGGKLVITVDDISKKEILSDMELVKSLRTTVLETTGFDYDIKVVLESAPPPVAEGDVFANLGEVGKKFPTNFKLD